jgi:cytochrome P450
MLARRASAGDAAVQRAALVNALGFLTQAYDATAGLIANTLVELARHPDALAAVRAPPALLTAAVRETARHDSPVHNTRRYVHRAGTVAGQALAEGDAILVVLAAANRDPAANPNPTRFDLARRDARCFTFGAGPHGCPGETLAVTIATAGVARLLEAGLNVSELAGPHAYRSAPNTRVPIFAAAQADRAS